MDFLLLLVLHKLDNLEKLMSAQGDQLASDFQKLSDAVNALIALANTLIALVKAGGSATDPQVAATIAQMEALTASVSSTVTADQPTPPAPAPAP